MKARTIKKVLNKTMEAWLESITDTVVRESAREDLIITGGSICSMLMQEPVNDYDIYFKTKRTVKLIADYYVDKSKSNISVIDKDNIPENENHIDELNLSQWSVFVKSLERTEEERIKLFIPNVGYWSEDKDIEEKEDYRVIYITENAITLSNKIQLVLRFFGDAKEIHTNYDFVHATNYFHYENNKPKLVLRAEALEAILTRELIYIGSKYPLTSVIRTKKFIKRGFSITAGTYFKILWQVSELDLKDPVVLQEQLVGVDIAYFSLLIETLSKVDPELLNYNYISKIIDEIFQGDEPTEEIIEE